MAASELYERGRRILPVVLDQLASDNSQRLYASIPKGKNIADGFQEITVGDVANAVHSMAYWVHDTVGRGQHFETLAYVGINDLRYAVFWFAAIKCGYKVRNNPYSNTMISLLTYPILGALSLTKEHSESEPLVNATDAMRQVLLQCRIQCASRASQGITGDKTEFRHLRRIPV